MREVDYYVALAPRNSLPGFLSVREQYPDPGSTYVDPADIDVATYARTCAL